MQIFVQVRKKNEKQWILKTVYGKHSTYFSDFFKKNLNFLTVHLGRFCDNKNLFFENGRQKINLIINFLENENIWILRMLYGKHLLDF